jgi:hypothetical protein
VSLLRNCLRLCSVHVSLKVNDRSSVGVRFGNLKILAYKGQNSGA